MKDELRAIFKSIRNKFIWTADEESPIQWKGDVIYLKDKWTILEPDDNGILRGDCEDFSLHCSKVVKEQLGISKENRLLTYCKTETGEGHMILCVYVDDKEYVFDNRQRKLVTLKKLKRGGYRDFARPEGPIDSVWKGIDV